MKLPEYDAADAGHKALAALVEKAHGQHDETKRASLVCKIESDGEKILEAWMFALQNLSPSGLIYPQLPQYWFPSLNIW